MPGPNPNPAEIWQAGIEEGERRVSRGLLALSTTGLVGGFDVVLGITITATVAGAMSEVMPAKTAALIASLAFGVGFVFITIGRGELFSENFLIPVAALSAGRARLVSVLRLFGVTLVANIAGLLFLSWLVTRAGVLDPGAHKAAGRVADLFNARSVAAAFVSAVLAGAVMTLWTWLNEAAESDIARIALALIIGFTLSAPALNHVIVGTAEMAFGILGGQSSAHWADVAANFGIALAGNLVGGIGFVTLTRVVQAKGESG